MSDFRRSIAYLDAHIVKLRFFKFGKTRNCLANAFASPDGTKMPHCASFTILSKPVYEPIIGFPKPCSPQVCLTIGRISRPRRMRSKIKDITFFQNIRDLMPWDFSFKSDIT